MKTAAFPFACALSLVLLPVSASTLYAQAAGSEQHVHTAATPSTSLTLTLDGKTTTFSVADLQAMPQTTVMVHNEHTRADETYSGVLLGSLLAKQGFPVDKTTHRRMLGSYVIAGGTDNYRVLFSATEIEPSEHTGTVLVALSMNGKPLGEDGQIKLIASEDKRPERWVRNLNSITLKSAE